MAPKSIKSTFQYVTKISREDPGLIRRILLDDFFWRNNFYRRAERLTKIFIAKQTKKIQNSFSDI
jgi:hypothetical protein